MLRTLWGLALLLILHPLIASAELAIVAFPYPPYLMEDSSGPHGYVTDVWKEAVAGSEFDGMIHFYPLPRAHLMFRSGRAWVALGSADHYQAATSGQGFSAHRIGQTPFVLFYARHGAPMPPASLRELRGDTVCGQRESAATRALEDSGLHISGVTDIQSSISMVLAGRCKFGFGASYTIQASSEAMGVADQLGFVDFTFISVGLDILVSDAYPKASELNALLHRRLMEMRRSGALSRIAGHYFHNSASAYVPESMIVTKIGTH